ncbi:carbohydrate ABC transporter permease [Salinibacterium sp. PAMC 21357]|uniref:carbohydrate ABC transporter permease n=1 Tax=Salinibacterium sp. PAMC 21357 TaxID=1112215 RepID=UPI000289DAA1|nr:sugar ABC transporter permease [Salinibacterium sp. PAMC 21357]
MSKKLIAEANPLAALSPRAANAGSAKKPRQGQGYSARRGRIGLLFLAPWFVGILLLVIAPLIASAYFSLTDYDLITRPNFIGFDNYERMATDDRFWQSMKVTGTYVLFSVPFTLIASLAVAMLLKGGLKALSFFRLVFYLPSLLGASVAIAVVWRQMFSGDGLINGLLALVGIDGPAWVSNPDYSLGTVILLAIWQFGSPMVIFLAGLKQIPESLYDAAALDGASRIQVFRNVTLPLLSPVIFFNLVLGFINAFQAFTPAFIISGGSGGPADSNLFITLYLFQQGFGALDMGYAAALAWVLVIVVGLVTAVNFALQKYWVFYEDRT